MRIGTEPQLLRIEPGGQAQEVRPQRLGDFSCARSSPPSVRLRLALRGDVAGGVVAGAVELVATTKGSRMRSDWRTFGSCSRAQPTGRFRTNRLFFSFSSWSTVI